MATYVLVSGAGGDPWLFHRLVPELEAQGHEAVAVTLPAGDDNAGWAEYRDAIVAAIGDRSDVILVAQSLAGFSAPLACDRVAVRLLVLLNAMIPRPGETGMEWWSNTGQGAAQREYVTSIGIPVETAEDDEVVYLHDLPPDVAAAMRARPQLQQSMTPMDQPWPLQAWPSVPTAVLVGRDDRLFPAAFQRRVARERLGLTVEEIPGGHLAALSHPAELAEALDRLQGPG